MVNWNIDIGPFDSYEDMVMDLREYERIREEGKVNMFALGAFWDRKKLLHIMNLYRTGDAEEILKVA